MARQYGAPPDDPGEKKGPGYSDRRRDAPPTPKDPDPSPSRDVVEKFHRNASVNTRDEDIHHTIGPGGAASYSHSHKGSDSVALFEGMTISGSKGGNAALASVIAMLVEFGAKDSTT